MPEVRAINLQNLINEESGDILEEVLKDVNEKKSIDDIIKILSLQNILNQLTILNSNKFVHFYF